MARAITPREQWINEVALWEGRPAPFATCHDCCGEGSNEVPKPQRDDPYYAVVVKCETCNGSGWVQP